MKGTIVVVFIVLATAAAIFAARHEAERPLQEQTTWVRTVAYWLFTILVAFEMAAGSLWDLLRIEYVRVIFAHLGYPLYLLFILGTWKLLCTFALLVPRFPRLKEWAYAGAVFNYTGAAASHLLVGDALGEWAGPLVLAAFTFASWALRPPPRRLPRPVSDATMPAITWYVPVLITVVMLVVALFTLPQGAPPH